MTRHLFTYGSLMYPAVWQQIVSQDYDSETVTLKGYQRKCVLDQEYPAVVYTGREEDQVIGRVYFDVSPQDQVALDVFEGKEYLRRTEQVQRQNQQFCEVDVYVYRPEYHAHLSEQDWCVDTFEREGLPKFIAAYKGFKAIEA